LQGVIHTHTTYSDGLNTLSEMAHYAKTKGFKYIGITDHSKAAFYANGLKEERLYQQWAEIDALNKTFTDFTILKGIESDILNDGSLDYAEGILKQFDFIIASIHTNLKMDIDKATTRLIKAIENPYTTILGHPTGRLLLSREGYPIDYQKVIDACAANRVAIELNAHPYRLDLDWTKISMAMDKGVLIGIHPDAHSCAGIDHVQYGVFAAQKGGLEPKNCLNCLNINDFLNYKKTI
jgi:DNA polymerase (family X)